MKALSLLALISFTASAAPVTFVSGDALNEGNDKSGKNLVVEAHAAWAQPMLGAQWINGWSYEWPESTTAVPVARFYETFVLGAGTRTGTLWLHADDSAHVYVNGALAFAGSFVLDGACSQGAGGCEAHERAEVDISALLIAGANRIDFDLFQLGWNVAGIMYGGEAEARSDISATPEPLTWHLIALPLLVIGACARWTRRAS